MLVILAVKSIYLVYISLLEFIQRSYTLFTEYIPLFSVACASIVIITSYLFSTGAATVLPSYVYNALTASSHSIFVIVPIALFDV